MSYILEFIFVYNQKSLRKFMDYFSEEDRKQYDIFEQSIIDQFKHNNDFIAEPIIHTKFNYTKDNGDIIRLFRYGKFKTLDAAERFYVERQTSSNPIRVKATDAALMAHVLGEFNIINENENVIKVLASCQQGICNRRDDKQCTVHTDNPGCYDPNEFDPRKIPGDKVHHIPLSSIKRINSK
jgi:hypothetical protein